MLLKLDKYYLQINVELNFMFDNNIKIVKIILKISL